MANRSVLTGRLTADPELKYTPQGNVPVVSFTIAVHRKFKKDVVDFIDIVAWRKLAEFLCTYFTKGKWVEVDGSIQTRTYKDRNGVDRKAFEIVADEINFVGDKPKEDGAPSNGGTAVTPPPPPPNFDPFTKAAPPPSRSQTNQTPPYSGGSLDDFREPPDDDGDLPF